MVRRSSKRKAPELKVVFDTNAIFTGSASDLFRREVSELITANSEHQDLTITWHLPEMVVHERQYQMLRRALELLPSIEKLERLIGHKLAITADILEDRVRESVAKQLQQHRCDVLKLDVTEVDWDNLMLAAAYRKAPFDIGEKEKGFRDAVVLESFIQLLAASPVTPKVCRVVLITSDALLAEAATGRTSDVPNVRILEDTEALKGLISTLVAEVDEEFVRELLPRAKMYFFEKNNPETMYYREGVKAQLGTKYSKELELLPPGAHRRKNGTWYINEPRFAHKEGQRVTFVTRVRIAASAFGRGKPGRPDLASLLAILAKQRTPEPDVAPEREFLNNPESSGSQSSPPSPAYVGGLFSSSSGFESAASGRTEEPEEEVTTGNSILEVTWSVSVATNGKLSTARIESLDFIETVWDVPA